MDIERINSYTDPRFPQETLYQHGAFLVDGTPCSFRIISGHEAVVEAENLSEDDLREAAENFRFYTEHITTFYDICEAVVGIMGIFLLSFYSASCRAAKKASHQSCQFFICSSGL